MQKIQLINEDYNLSETEKLGDPQAVALELLNVQTIKEEAPIAVPRASKLCTSCMRMYVIGNKTGILQTQWSDFAGRLTFGIGNAIHDWCQNTDNIFGGKRRGFWECLNCGYTDKTKFTAKLEVCDKCKSKAIKYREFGAHVKKPVEFTFHVDMFLAVRDMIRTVEIKTINGKDFDALVAPLAIHEYQLTVYTIGVGIFKKILCPNFDGKVGYILYISKQHKQKELPIKMYPVKIQSSLIDSIMEKLMLFKVGLKTYPKELPECDKKCNPPHFNTYVAKYCPAKQTCMYLYDQGVE